MFTESTILLYSKRQDDVIMVLVKELENWLNFLIKNVSYELLDNIKRRNPEVPLLVLCINSTRCATDASNAIQGITEFQHTSLVVFHHRDVHALSFTPSSRAFTDPAIKALAGIYDIAFLQDKGIYHCDLNEKAINGIVAFLRKYV
ncbi:uncharacterized protein LOC123545578 [Mercenaria mercenaria]|uniref:uncharacterized protein LOC123545578 n=1 Tax=Mercenaria mercenaria TaxID=6596 RepID=UPI001E1D4F3E|nr:uncharacterized protein LOC123545578 [Mercenaria mercenaria]